MRKCPESIQSKVGSVVEPARFYKSKSITLRSVYGEVIIVAPSDLTLDKIASVIMPSTFILDMSKSQDVAVFSADRVIEEK